MSSQSDKRSLHRNSTKYGLDIKGYVQSSHSRVPVDIVDMNSTGVRVRFASDIVIDEYKVLELYYAEELICKCTNPTVVRIEGLETVLSLKDTPSGKMVERPTRVELTNSFQGLLCGVDPFSVDQVLFFKVTNISTEGLRLSTSRANSHLPKEIILRNFELQIPGFRKRKLTVQIKNIDVVGENLEFGCKILEANRQTLQDLAVIKLMLSDLATNPLSSDDIKKIVKHTRHFKGLIKVRYSRTLEDYRKVLDLRFRSYKAANKTRDQQTVEDMGDEYDRHAVILLASLGRNIVGTLRIVFREKGTQLPFEKLIAIDQVKQINPDQAAEVSRFAIDPLFQGSDVFMAISKQLVMELTLKKVAYPVCLATPALAPSYIALGGIRVSEAVPHPTLKNETMTLYWLKPDNVYAGKTGALSWFFIVRPALKKLTKIGSLTRVPFALHQYVLFVQDFFKFFLLKKLKKRKTPKSK